MYLTGKQLLFTIYLHSNVEIFGSAYKYIWTVCPILYCWSARPLSSLILAHKNTKSDERPITINNKMKRAIICKLFSCQICNIRFYCFEIEQNKRAPLILSQKCNCIDLSHILFVVVMFPWWRPEKKSSQTFNPWDDEDKRVG